MRTTAKPPEPVLAILGAPKGGASIAALCQAMDTTELRWIMHEASRTPSAVGAERISTAVTPRRAGRSTGHATALKEARYALGKKENLTGQQQAKLAWIAKTHPRLHRAYLLKEGLRLISSLDPAEAPAALDRWISWARRRIDAFVQLQRQI